MSAHKSFGLLLAFSFASSVVPSLAMGQASTPAPVVTLAEARRRAATIDPEAVAARSRVETASWERRAARANMFTPNLTGGISYIRFSEPFFNFGTGSISPNATAATLEARYTVLGAGKFGTLKSSSASLESAEASETAARFQTALVTDAAYFAVLADRELSRVAADRLKRAEEQFGIARVRVLAGEAIASDSLQLMLEVIRARAAVLKRDSALVTSRLRLGNQIGLSGPVEASPVDSALPPLLPFTEEEAARELSARGPDVEAARADERRADALLLVEREQYIPELSLGFTTGAYDQQLFPSALKRSQLAVTISVPFWDGGQRELAVARAQGERNVARAVRLDRERSSAERMSSAYHGYLTARANIELAAAGVTVSTEAYRVQRARYREGATTILDLLEAQVALSEAEAALVQSRFGTRLALAQIEALLGRRVFASSTTEGIER